MIVLNISEPPNLRFDTSSTQRSVYSTPRPLSGFKKYYAKVYRFSHTPYEPAQGISKSRNVLKHFLNNHPEICAILEFSLMIGALY